MRFFHFFCLSLSCKPKKYSLSHMEFHSHYHFHILHKSKLSIRELVKSSHYFTMLLQVFFYFYLSQLSRLIYNIPFSPVTVLLFCTFCVCVIVGGQYSHDRTNIILLHVEESIWTTALVAWENDKIFCYIHIRVPHTRC